MSTGAVNAQGLDCIATELAEILPSSTEECDGSATSSRISSKASAEENPFGDDANDVILVRLKVFLS